MTLLYTLSSAPRCSVILHRNLPGWQTRQANQIGGDRRTDRNVSAHVWKHTHGYGVSQRGDHFDIAWPQPVNWAGKNVRIRALWWLGITISQTTNPHSPPPPPPLSLSPEVGTGLDGARSLQEKSLPQFYQKRETERQACYRQPAKGTDQQSSTFGPQIQIRPWFSWLPTT